MTLVFIISKNKVLEATKRNKKRKPWRCWCGFSSPSDHKMTSTWRSASWLSLPGGYYSVPIVYAMGPRRPFKKAPSSSSSIERKAGVERKKDEDAVGWLWWWAWEAAETGNMKRGDNKKVEKESSRARGRKRIEGGEIRFVFGRKKRKNETRTARSRMCVLQLLLLLFRAEETQPCQEGGW